MALLVLLAHLWAVLSPITFPGDGNAPPLVPLALMLTLFRCFYINLPFGGIAAAFIVFFLRLPRRGKKVDLTWKQQLLKL